MAKNRVNFASYPQDYFTGAQARIYIGSIWVDDIATISYTTSHSKTPLYGYNDHQFRSVAKGQFLVRGSFTVAFKETGYLYEIIQMWRKDNTGINTLSSIFAKNQNNNNGKTNGSQPQTGAAGFINILQSSVTIEEAMDQVNDSSSNPQDFEDAAEVLQNAIWGKTAANVKGTGNANPNRIPRSDELDYECYLNNDITTQDINRDGFDILMTFGDYRSGDASAETTIISINGVHITGESMIVSPTAEPIGINFEFFARGINERVSNAWPDSNRSKADQARKDQMNPSELASADQAQAQNPQVNNTTTPQSPDPSINGADAPPKTFGSTGDQVKFNTDVARVQTDFKRMANKLTNLMITIQKAHANDTPPPSSAQTFAACFSKLNIQDAKTRQSLVPATTTNDWNALVHLYTSMQPDYGTWKPDDYYFATSIIYYSQSNQSANLIQDPTLKSMATQWDWASNLEPIIDRMV